MPIRTADINAAKQLRTWSDAGTLLDFFSLTEALQVRIRLLDIIELPGQALMYDLEVVEAGAAQGGEPAPPSGGGATGFVVAPSITRQLGPTLTPIFSGSDRLGPLAERTVLAISPGFPKGEVNPAASDLQQRTALALGVGFPKFDVNAPPSGAPEAVAALVVTSEGDFVSVAASASTGNALSSSNAVTIT